MGTMRMSRRSVALVASVLSAAIGTVLLFGYVRGIEKEALAGTDPVEVLVAKEAIAAGTTAEEASSQGLFTKQELPKVAVLDGAVGGVDALAGKAAVVDILKGEQIVADRFAAPDEGRGLLPIPEGRQAMSVEVTLPPGVAGFIEAGDRVSVIANIDDPEPKTRFVLQNVQVLTVGRRVVDGDPEDGGLGPDDERVMYTLAVTPAGAEQLAYAVLQGDIYFTLLPPGQDSTPTPGRSAQTLFN